MTRLIATFFYIGLLRPAPGTWGSLAAIPIAWGIHWLAGPIGLALATIGLFAAGLWATERETLDSGDEDPSEIVVDEVIGQWIALLPVSVGAASAGVAFGALWPGIVTAFFAFRLFDIWKPFVIGTVDRRGDALGILLDDALAGVAAAAVVIAFAVLAHGAA
ncbi:MAG: phosphatidylglycerophosphatase A [Paracoccaceae bacterium]|nr:phosphatidylglycerophosphatase A [Paracoccaceae bacterium]